MGSVNACQLFGLIQAHILVDWSSFTLNAQFALLHSLQKSGDWLLA